MPLNAYPTHSIFKKASKKIKNAVIVDTNREIEAVVNEITEIILTTQAKRTRKILIDR